MQRITIDELKPLMVLAATIKDGSGTVILTKGTTVIEQHIIVLNKREIKKVSVEGHPVDRGGSLSEGIGVKIDERFSTAGTRPITLKIKDRIKELLS